MKLGFNYEPAVIAAAIRAVLLAFQAFFLKWSAEQIAVVMVAVEAVLALITRSVSTSQATLEKAGTSQAEVAAVAKNPAASMFTRGNAWLLPLLLVGSIGVTGCASAGGNIDAKVTAVASYGARVSQVLVAAQDLVVKGTPSPIPEATTAKIQVQFKTIAGVGHKLTDALELFDALSPSDTARRLAAIEDIQRIMDELRRYTRVVLVLTGENGVGTQLLALYDNLDTVFAEIQAGLDQWELAAAAKG